MKLMSKLVATLFLGLGISSAHATPTTFDFVGMANGSVYGESAYNTLDITQDGINLKITGTYAFDDDSTQYAYLDSGWGGLGVCPDLVSGATIGALGHSSSTNLCAPSSDDNVKSSETLHFNFSSNVIIDWITFNNNHDYDYSLYNDSIDIGPYTYQFGTNVNGNTGSGDYKATFNDFTSSGFDISYNNSQFYVSAIQVRAVPEPATLALMGIGLIGLGFSRRKRTH